MSNVLHELDVLTWTRPGLCASAAEVAAWYRRKALMLEHLAEARELAADQAAEWATAAHRHADFLSADPGHDRVEVAA